MMHAFSVGHALVSNYCEQAQGTPFDILNAGTARGGIQTCQIIFKLAMCITRQHAVCECRIECNEKIVSVSWEYIDTLCKVNMTLVFTNRNTTNKG